MLSVAIGFFVLLCGVASNSRAAVPLNQVVITFGSLSERETALFVAQDYGIFAKRGTIKWGFQRGRASLLTIVTSTDYYRLE